MFYLFLADGFEEIEALAPLDIMLRAKLEVKTVGVTGEFVTSSHGVSVKADIKPEEISLENTDGVILPGGLRGTLNLMKSECVASVTKYCFDNGKLIAAICAAPSVLGNLGILKGKKAICYPGFENRLEGASLTDAPVVVDGNVITSKGPGCSILFGKAIVEKVLSAEAANKICGEMQCP